MHRSVIHETGWNTEQQQDMDLGANQIPAWKPCCCPVTKVHVLLSITTAAKAIAFKYRTKACQSHCFSSSRKGMFQSTFSRVPCAAYDDDGMFWGSVESFFVFGATFKFLKRDKTDNRNLKTSLDFVNTICAGRFVNTMASTRSNVPDGWKIWVRNSEIKQKTEEPNSSDYLQKVNLNWVRPESVTHTAWQNSEPREPTRQASFHVQFQSLVSAVNFGQCKKRRRCSCDHPPRPSPHNIECRGSSCLILLTLLNDLMKCLVLCSSKRKQSRVCTKGGLPRKVLPGLLTIRPLTVFPGAKCPQPQKNEMIWSHLEKLAHPPLMGTCGTSGCMREERNNTFSSITRAFRQLDIIPMTDRWAHSQVKISSFEHESVKNLEGNDHSWPTTKQETKVFISPRHSKRQGSISTSYTVWIWTGFN